MATHEQKIHEAVRRHYGAIARSVPQENLIELRSTTSCCNDSVTDCGCGPGLYDATLLDGLPSSVTDLSLGCGDPVTIAALRPGETVLDLGSGGGIDCFMAARQVGTAGYVIGIDMTPDMLAQANLNKIRLNMTNVEFRHGQIEALPVEDNSIDVIMSNCVINLSPDKAAVFREAVRVLKPGGRIAISDIVTAGDFSEALQAQLDKWSACVTGAIDAEQYIELMRQAGFTNIELVDKTDPEGIIKQEPGMPRIFSARITAQKPA